MQAASKLTTVEHLEHYIATPDMSSSGLQWEGILVRYYKEPNQMALRIVPSLPDLHIVVILSAALEIEQRSNDSDWVKTRIQTGDVFIVPPFTETYQMRWQNQSHLPIETLQIFLDQSLLKQIAREQLGIDYSHFYILERDPIKDPFLFQIAMTLKGLLESKGLGEKFFAQTLAQAVALYVLREHAHLTINATTRKSNLPAYRLRKIEQYIQANLSKAISLEELADQAGMSLFHFSRLFKTTMGISPNQYILAQKISKAKELLTESALSVSQTALEVGFESLSHFTAQFKKNTGQTPTQYRK